MLTHNTLLFYTELQWLFRSKNRFLTNNINEFDYLQNQNSAKTSTCEGIKIIDNVTYIFPTNKKRVETISRGPKHDHA